MSPNPVLRLTIHIFQKGPNDLKLNGTQEIKTSSGLIFSGLSFFVAFLAPKTTLWLASILWISNQTHVAKRITSRGRPWTTGPKRWPIFCVPFRHSWQLARCGYNFVVLQRLELEDSFFPILWVSIPVHQGILASWMVSCKLKGEIKIDSAPQRFIQSGLKNVRNCSLLKSPLF